MSLENWLKNEGWGPWLHHKDLLCLDLRLRLRRRNGRRTDCHVMPHHTTSCRISNCISDDASRQRCVPRHRKSTTSSKNGYISNQLSWSFLPWRRSICFKDTANPLWQWPLQTALANSLDSCSLSMNGVSLRASSNLIIFCHMPSWLRIRSYDHSTIGGWWNRWSWTSGGSASHPYWRFYWLIGQYKLFSSNHRTVWRQFADGSPR